MKCFPDRRARAAGLGACAIVAAAVTLGALEPSSIRSLLFVPGHAFGNWLENIRSGSAVEGALYRLMDLPGGSISFRRSPRETIPALTELQRAQNSAALLPLRAMEEEQGLQFAAAEQDWKTWAESAADRSAGHRDLADFYERRLQPRPELAALEYVGNAPSPSSERWTAVESQNSWRAFERALRVVDEYGLPRSEADAIYAAWIRRYPRERTIYERRFASLLESRQFSAAESLLARFRQAFPQDRVFPVKAAADLAVRRGRATDGLAVYDAQFQPLWPAELIRSYFALVLSSHGEHALADTLRARIAANPDDLANTARLFYLYQQQGQLDSAKGVLSRFRESKEARGASWSAVELDTLEKLFEAIQDFPEAARYAYALASDRTAPDSERKGVVALARILLTAPEQPLRVGAGNLALYRNIATMDRGPGYLNGILSLFLNTQGASGEYATEDQLATPYFHRARAAELLSQIDARFPSDPARPQLHASLMEAYGVYGENSSVIHEGAYILAQFPHYSGRLHVALLLAGAYERSHQVDKEFALYQDLLKELSAQADGVPLGAQDSSYSKPVRSPDSTSVYAIPAPQITSSQPNPGDDSPPATVSPGARSPEYAQVLDRYLARLVSLQRLPDALALLRGELDRNPQDPGLYLRLAEFLQQNSLDSHIEEVYQRAIQQFQDTNWYAKLARFYLRQRRTADYTLLMHKVADVFNGTELERFLAQAPAPNASLALQVDRYAHAQFPHDLRFTQRLIAEYSAQSDYAQVEQLLWEHWYESPALRDRLFGLLTRTGRLDSTLATLRKQAPEIDKSDWNNLAARNPAAERLWLEACLWQSHYEQGAGAAAALADVYPADAAIGGQASSLYRSLAYFHPEDTDKAVAIQKHLLEAALGNLDTLARIGDIYADRERFAEASPYWIRMAAVHPGEADGYLQSATVFWDYFDFASAQEEIQKGRTRLGQPTLFGYEVGAIDESRGNLAGAIQAYTESAIAVTPSSESRDRLLALARRPALRTPIENDTAPLLQRPDPTASAIELRADILKAEHRRDDLVRDLNDLVSRTRSFDVLDAVVSTARAQELPSVEESALRRQIALTQDPVRNLQLRYQLVDLLQQRDPSAAAHEVDAIYREHARILGVVRATVDYDWDHERKEQAITVLADSAAVSYPELKSQFQLEAARKLTAIGEYARSHSLLEELLKENPLDASYQAAMAENLADANDATSLDSFYRAQLTLVRDSKLNPDQKQQRIGELRRGVITASTQLGNYNQAVDQYIELINSFPDDAALAQEAAGYAVAHQNIDRLAGFYQKTIVDAPRDPRWSVVLARIATAADNYPQAIDAYVNALRLRPERQDLYLAQASLEEHLHRFDDAILLYRKMYVLSYRDPKWMEKVAELSMRAGRADEAIKALQAAWIDGRPAKPTNYFTVAEKLEKWNLLDDAQRFAEQGVQLAGADLLVSEQSGAAAYARILARKRESDAAFTRLAAARAEAPKLGLSAIARQVVQQGPAAVTNEEWRQQRAQQRSSLASVGFATALQAMGAVAADYYTPDEKAHFAALLRQHAQGAPLADLQAVYLPAAKAARLADLISDFEWNSFMASQGKNGSDLSEWLQFQKQRVQMHEAGALLEKTAPSMASAVSTQMYEDAASAYRSIGDTVAELRVTEHLYNRENMQGEALDRFYRLLLAQRPEELIHMAVAEDTAAAYLVRHGTAAQALAGIAARAGARPPVWRAAYAGLTGLYAHVSDPAITSAFANALDSNATIGERVDHPTDRNQHLAGDVWFHYGSRYAEYLDDAHNPQAADFLPSELEQTPGNAGAYLRLADYSASTAREGDALDDYRHSLDLRPDQPAVLDRIAVLQWNRGKQQDADANWKTAVQRLAQEMDARRVPETFWSDFQRVIGSISEHKRFDAVREPVDTMLRTYVARNGNYRVEPLLEAAYHANGDSIDWLFSITEATSNQAGVLNAIVPNAWSGQGQWIRPDQVDRIFRRILDVDERRSSADDGSTDADRQHLVDALIREKKFEDARAELAKVSPALRNAPEWLLPELQVAEADGTLSAIVAKWGQQPATAPAEDALRQAALHLAPGARRTVLRFLYQRALDRRELTAPNFLGLAAIDLDEHETGNAVALLRRLALVSSDMYSDADAAARLLETHHLPAQALEFLRPLADANPWNSHYRLRAAEATLELNGADRDALSSLADVAADGKTPYAVRVAAAAAIRGKASKSASSEELNLLEQSACPSFEAASKPYFVAGRLRAAECSAAPRTQEQLLLHALSNAPEDARTRLRYIFAAFAMHYDSRALLAADPYLQGYPYYGPSNDTENAGQTDDTVDSSQEAQAATLAALPAEEATHLVELAAAAYEHRGDYSEAIRVLKMAEGFVHGSPALKLLQDRQKQAESQLARSHENDLRAPAIRPALDQPNIVHPKIRRGEPVPMRAKVLFSEDQP